MSFLTLSSEEPHVRPEGTAAASGDHAVRAGPGPYPRSSHRASRCRGVLLAPRPGRRQLLVQRERLRYRARPGHGLGEGETSDRIPAASTEPVSASGTFCPLTPAYTDFAGARTARRCRKRGRVPSGTVPDQGHRCAEERLDEPAAEAVDQARPPGW